MRKKKRKTYTLKYKHATVRLPFNPRKGVCMACGKSVKKGEIKVTQMHHYRYAYSVTQVKKHPELALRNTLELCYTHHQLADAIRVITHFHPSYFEQVFKVHPKYMKDRLIYLCRLLDR